MTEIVTAIYDLMGKIVEPMLEDDVIREKVERLFQVRIFKIPLFSKSQLKPIGT